MGKWGRSRRDALCALAVVAVLAWTSGPILGQSAPTGVWNLRSQDRTDRATGGVRVVLLRVEDDGGGLRAELTSIRNTFMPVDELRWDGAVMRVVFGSYEYELRFEGEHAWGTVTSPLGTQEIEGSRQRSTLMYVGDQPEPFRTTRGGVLGHVVLLDPPMGEADPSAWVRSRIASVEDLALVVGRRAKVAIGFTNALDFERQLLELAGRQVTVVGTWVGDRLRIESVRAGAP